MFMFTEISVNGNFTAIVNPCQPTQTQKVIKQLGSEKKLHFLAAYLINYFLRYFTLQMIFEFHEIAKKRAISLKPAARSFLRLSASD